VNAATPGQEGLDEALRIIAEAAHRLQTDAPSRAVNKDLTLQIEDIKRSTTRLGEAVKQIIAASRTSPEKMGGLSKDAASSVLSIADSAKALANSAGKQSSPSLKVLTVIKANNPYSAKRQRESKAMLLNSFHHVCLRILM
jgi:hypothetical protein